MRRRGVLAASAVLVALGAAWLGARHELVGALIARPGASSLADALVARGVRPFQARLISADATYGPHTAPRGDVDTDPVAVDVLRVLADTQRGADSEDLTESGVFRLVTGSVNSGVRYLERAVLFDLHDWRPYAHLAVGYLVRSDDGTEAADLARSLEYLNVAARLGAPRAATLFNRALVLEKLGMTTAAADAWRAFIRSSDDSGWRSEAQEHLDDLDTPPVEWSALLAALRVQDTAWSRVLQMPERAIEFSEWQTTTDWGRAILAGDVSGALLCLHEGRAVAAVLKKERGNELANDIWAAIVSAEGDGRRELAHGHVLLGEAIDLYDKDRRSEASSRFEQSAVIFRTHRSPAWLWAELHLAVINNQRRELDLASRRLSQLRHAASSRAYPVILARESLSRGIALLYAQDVSAAMAQFRESIALYEQQQTHAYAAIAYNTAADALRVAGDRRTAWGYIIAALRSVQRIPSAFRQYQIYFEAALMSLHEGLPNAALVFQTRALEAAERRGNVGFVVEALIRRSIVHSRRGDRDAQTADLERATSLLRGISDSSQLAYHVAWLRACLADALKRDAPAMARLLLASARERFSVIEPAELPQLWLATAETAMALGWPDQAREDLFDGVAVFEARLARLQTTIEKVSYFDRSWDVHEQLVRHLWVNEGDATAALKYADRAHARSLAEFRGDVQDVDVSRLQAELDRDQALVSYFRIDDRLLWWLISRSEVHAGEVPIDRPSLDRLAISAHAALAERRDADANRLLAELYRVMVEPLPIRDGVSTLVAVSDGPLHRVPFAALRDPHTGSYLIDRFTIATAPSIRMALSTSLRLAEASRESIGRVLIVGDSAAQPEFGLPALPQVKAEVEEVAAQYDVATVLYGADATKKRFLAEVPSADVVHFGGHAVADEAHPEMAFLALSKSEPVFGFELQQLRPIRARLVVLAACRTADGPLLKGEGPISLAWPLMAAGASSVIASLWDIEDADARPLVRTLHAGVARGWSSARALRDAQLRLRNVTRDNHDKPSKWASLAALGGVPMDFTPSRHEEE